MQFYFEETIAYRCSDPQVHAVADSQPLREMSRLNTHSKRLRECNKSLLPFALRMTGLINVLVAIGVTAKRRYSTAIQGIVYVNFGEEW